MDLNPLDCTDCEHRDQCDEAGRLLCEIAWNSEVHDFKKFWTLNLLRKCPRDAHTLPFIIASAAEKVFFEEHRLLTFRELAELNDKLEKKGGRVMSDINMVFYSDRLEIERAFNEWADKNGVAKVPNALVAFLDINGLLNTVETVKWCRARRQKKQTEEGET